MSKLSDTFYVKRAGTYSAPLNTNAALPVVYGDLTDGIDGLWELPCLNSTDWVYAYAGSEVLSLANGNSIVIYEDGLILTGGGVDYTFDEKNDYEGHGFIATIDMVHPKLNAVITATGMGKPRTIGGSVLMENLIDIVYDFLTVENDFVAGDFEETYKTMASHIFRKQRYYAAGVIYQDREIWEIITEMMASFLGSAYLDGDGDLVLAIDDGTLLQYGQAATLRKSEIDLKSAKQRLCNIINQCPCEYGYDYVLGLFKYETDASAHADAASQGIYGVKKPSTPYQFYWCRDTTDVQTIQDIIVDKFKSPLYEIEIDDQTITHIGVDQGDVFLASIDSLYDKEGFQLLNNYWKCVGVRHDYANSKISFRALQTAYFLTIAYIADGTYKADGSIKAGGNRDSVTY